MLRYIQGNAGRGEGRGGNNDSGGSLHCEFVDVDSWECLVEGSAGKQLLGIWAMGGGRLLYKTESTHRNE